jgi:uncharacterized membrane protein (UPF0127 family)
MPHTFFKQMNRAASFVLAIGASALIVQPASAEPAQKFPATTLTAGMYVIQAEVAATPDQREQGLMFRKQMAENDGMIFLFGGPAKVCMWMKNTLIPLSVAFLDQNGKVINIEEMQPQTLTSHCSHGYVPYALEMNRGWFKQKNIKPGSIIKGLPPVERGQRSQ